MISTENSDVDMSYFINFENITDDKPQNMIFKIKGNEKEYKSLQELEKTLTGIAKKNSKTIVGIEWNWPYEIDNEQDVVDTENGEKLESYKFKINVKGEEVI